MSTDAGQTPNARRPGTTKSGFYYGRTPGPEEPRRKNGSKPAAKTQRTGRPERLGPVSVRLEIAENPATPADTLLWLLQDKSPAVRTAAILHPKFPEREFAVAAHGSDSGGQRAMLEGPNATARVELLLAQHGSDSMRRTLARDAYSPAAVLVWLSKDPDPGVLQNVALNPSTPASTLVRLSRSIDDDVLYCVARNPSTPADALARMLQSGAWWARKPLARNPSTSIDVLTALAGDEIRDVRRGVVVTLA